MPEDGLKKAWEELITKVGPFQKQLGIKAQDDKDYKLVLVTCQFEREPMGIRVVYDTQQHVSGLWYVEPDPAMISK